MLAQVFMLGPVPDGADATLGPVAEAAIEETRATAGCEGLLLLTRRAGGEGLAIVLWRDDASLDAMRQRQEEHLDEIRGETHELPHVPPAELFDVITA
jgi:hypothetical protein